MNANRNPSWSCPHCFRLVHPDDLARDLLTESLMKRLPKNVSEIEFTKDHENFKISKVDDPDTDDEDGNDDSEKGKTDMDKMVTEKGVKSEDLAIAEVPSNTTVIDLISDDEDDDETPIANIPPPKRPRFV